ncbi:MAG TPA: hypothetical protein VFH46_01005 [Pyrinomonadaceae bacterium]|nr:hypothetical protein [Pyrinomonadaceae bacterium]
MRIRRYSRSVVASVTNFGATLFKVVFTSFVLGMIVVSVMHYMGVPVPSANDLLRGVSRLAHVFS